MRRRSRSGLIAAACSLGLLWGGLAQAYLSPDYTNPTYDPIDINTGLPGVNYPWTPAPGDKPDYLTTPNWANSPVMRKFVDLLPGIPGVTTYNYNLGAGYNADGTTNLGQSMPAAAADTTTYPGSDYYEIAVVEYTEQMHSDLPAPGTTLRGYVQLETSVVTGDHYPLPGGYFGVHKPHYLGPVIICKKDRPVRVKFVNLLPTGAGGELFIPVDTTVMGSGPFEINYDPVTKQDTATVTGDFTQNRATLHLHGGRSPWISDGTPHQWITPAGEVTDYPTGVSVSNVPDMPDPGPGAQTFYWTNQQSARLMFYHDHAWGITRLNVYVGEAAGYLIQDPVELDLVNGTNVTGVNPNNLHLLPADQIPLVIEDKTFVDATSMVPDPRDPTPLTPTMPLVPAIKATDPLWRWGTGAVTGSFVDEFGKTVTVREPKTGDLWWPHVYMPAQNPFDITGIAPMGRWAYGPYFYPATPNPYQPVDNPYYNENCDPFGDPATTPGILGGPYGQFCQPLQIPGTPDVSWGAEAFMDTQTVNGAVYPTVTLEPKPYRLRILNASHDRFLNLSLFKADTTVDPNTAILGDPLTTASAALCLQLGGCATETEMKMVPAATPAAPPPGLPATWPVDGRAGGVPDYSTIGPDWIMLGTEGGFLPQPVVIPPHPVTWNVNPSMFNVGNINGGSLILGPAERADVVVDFSTVAPGTTLILYNDGAAPWPALNPTYDYYTGDPDQRDVGGADTTLPGFGPNTRTIMQIKIAGTAGASFDLGALQEAFTSRVNHPLVPGDNHPSVFQAGQDPMIVAQGNMNPTADPNFYEAFLGTQQYDGYTKAYDPLVAFPTQYPNWGISRINDQNINFIGIDGSTTYKYDKTQPNNAALAMKRKAIHDEMGATWDDYGRMRAGLGLELSNLGPLQVNFIIQTYSDPSTEILEENGIQVWKITHNGVDTHPIHFHLYDVQVLNRVGWDGFIRLPDPTEIGWKDTVRISPLEDTIVAIKPVTPAVPFGIPESNRPKNPATPLGSNVELTQIDPYTGQRRTNLNSMYNFDWEYVWHCHILSHEENDMMRPQSFLFQESLPGAPTGLAVSNAGVLTWTDATPKNDPASLGNGANEIGFRVERAGVVNGETGAFAATGSALANATSYTDATIAPFNTYAYRVVAFNAAGDSAASNTTDLVQVPAAPTGLTGAVADSSRIDLSWTDNAGNETGYSIERAVGAGAFTPLATRPANATTYSDTTVAQLTTYKYRVFATNTAGSSAASNTVTVTTPILSAGVPGTPIVPVSSLTGTYNVTWAASATAGATYELQEAQDNAFTTGLRTVTVGGTALSAAITRPSGRVYWYRVRASAVGFSNSAWVNSANGCTVQPTAMPGAMTVPATSSTGDYTVSWGASFTTGATYEVQEAQNSGFTTGLRTVVVGTSALSASITGRPSGRTYWYRVRAKAPGFNNSNWRSSTNGCTVTLVAVAPGAPIVPANSPTGNYSISWSASSTPGAIYDVQEAQDSAFTTGLRTVATGTTSLSATITARLPGRTYWYRARTRAPGYTNSAWVNSANGCAVP